ncbi:MAG: Ig-like domain-containing protein [Turneriella sp.]
MLAVSRDPNNSNIVFVDTIPQASGSQYTVTASNIVGVDGASLGSSNSATFTAPNNADQTGPLFSSVSITSGTTLEVFFDEALDGTTSATAGNYRFYTGASSAAAVAACQADGTFSAGTVAMGSVRDSANFAKVTLTRSAMTTGTIYAIGARNVRDIWGNAVANTTCSVGYLYTASTPKVVSAVSSSPTSVLLTFDQAMKDANQPTPAVNSTPLTTRANYTITNCGTLSASAANFSVVSSTQILLSGLATGTTGTCTVTLNTAITSAAGVALTGATNFAVFGYSAADTTSPSVASVAPTNSNTVRVTFNEPINDATVGISDFNFSPALTVTGVTCYTGAGNYTYCDVATSTDQTTQSYTVTVSGINDVAGNALSTSTTTFTGDGKPYIVAYYPVDSGTVLVEWSEAIGNSASVGTADYTITPAGTITAASLYLPDANDRSKFVKLTISPVLTSGTTYTLSVNNPTGSVDSTNNGTLGTVPGGGTFTGPTATTAPQVSSASSPSPTTVLVNFNEPLNNSTIGIGDFVITGAGCASGVTGATQIQAGVVQLVLTSVASNGPSCTVTVGAGNVSDLAGNAIAATNNSATYAYTGTGTADTTPPTIGSVIALSNTQVRVYFSEPVATGGGANAGDNTANYSFSPALTGGVASASCTSTYCTLTLNAPGTSAVQYALTVSNVQDAAANTMSSASVSFSGIGSSATAPTLYMATLVNSTTVELSFSEIMDLTTSQNTANYTVSGGNTVSAAVRQADATKVRLTITPGAYGSSNSYTVTGGAALTDASGNVLGSPNSATFSGSATAPATSDLAATSDLGSSTTDNITSAAFPAPGLQFTGTVAANTTVYLYDDGILVATAVSDSSGNYSVTLTSAATVTAGANVFTVATVGPTGLVSDISPGLTVTYDSSAPAQPASLDLVAGSDTGISTTDNITNSATPSFTVSCENGSTVILRDGTTNITNPATGVTCSGGTATVVASTLAAGTYASINIVQTDVAGNTSVASTNLSPSLVIDTTAPALNTSPLTGNTTLTLTFSENVYTSTGAALATSDFAIAFAANGGTATGASITGITHTPPSGTVTLTISITGTVAGTETVTVTSVANQVFDAAGNAASIDTGAKTLSAIGVASITGTPTYTSTGATTGYISVTWSEGVYTNGGPASGSVVAGDFARTFTQNSGNSTDATVTCVTDTASASCPGTAPAAGATSMRIHLTNTGTTSGVETIQVSAASNAIYSATSGVTPTSVNTGTITFPDRLAPSAPASLALATLDDTGSSNSDRITSQTANLTISGTAEANSTVRLYQPNSGGTLLATVTADGSGNWSTDISLAAGSTYTVVATARDAALNVSADSSALSITIDTSAPAAPGTPDMTAGTDTGSSSTDNTTNNQTPSFTVSCENGASVQLRDTATATGTAGTCAGGTVTLTAGTLGSGAHSINAIQTDAAGNVSTASGNLSVTIDVTADAATGVPDMTAGTDSGSSSSDDITSNATPSFTVSCVTGSSVQLYDGASATGTVGTCAAGTVTLTAATLGTGAHNINAIQTDSAGNASTASSNLSVTIDTTADAAPGTPDMTAGTDSGSSSTDDITSNTTPSFTVSCVTGSSVQLRDNVTATGSAVTCAAGTATLTSAALSAGAHNINAFQTDAAGNVSSASSNLAVTIDTTADAAPGTPDLTNASDLGSSNTDNITNTTTPSFTVSCVTGSSVQLYDNLTATGTAVTCAASTATVTAAALSAGTHASMNARQTDAAGNQSVASGNLSITIDTTTDAAPGTPDLTNASDTGSSNSDDITNTTTPSFTVSCVTGSSVQLFDGVTATGTAVTCAAGTATVTAAALSAGTHASMNVIQTDVAGNASAASGNLSITIDTTADAATGTPDMTSATDTGSSNSDDITGNTTPSFTVSCVTGSSVQLYDNLTATGTPVTCAGGTATLTAAALSVGTHASMNAIQTDTAGNQSAASGNLSITIDTAADAATGTPDMTAGTDSGSSSTDNITNNATPSFTVSCVTGSSVQLYDNLTATGSAVTCAAGTATLTAATLSGGTHPSMNARQTDAAGNQSVASGNLSIAIDTTADAAPGTPDMTAGTDLGSSSTDDITSSTTPSFTVSCVTGSSVQLYDNLTATGSAVTCAASTATVTAGTLGAGAHTSMNAIQTDVAGNASPASGNLSITIDTTVPTISAVAPAANAYVKDTVVSFTFSEAVASGTVTWTRTGGTADGASHIQSLSGGELATGAHTSITLASPPTLVSGAIYTITWNATDAAGNTATAVSTTNVTYDTTLPVISAVTPASSSSVNSTSVSYTLSEVCQSGSITWTQTGGTADGSSPHTKALTGSELNAGTFTGNITNNPTLVDGAIYSVAFNCTDRAGNVGTTITSTNVTYSPGVLAITTADTLDTDNDGKIDTYRVSFNKPVNDSTFPGYSVNALGTVTANWLVAGYTNVRLIHGSAVTFATDTANDAVIYIRFDENVQTCSSASQVGCDTEAKPDLTTTASPGLQDLTAATIAQVTTGSVTESDQAKPVLIAARSLSTTTADAIFSETVETTTAQTATNYVITGGSNPTVTTATRDTTNTNIVHLVTGAQTGGQAYVLTVNTNVKDNANLSMNSSANTANFNGVQNPVVSGVVTTSATTLTITFNESVTAASTECSTTTACAAIFDNTSIPILSAVSTAGSGNNAATYTLTVNPMVEGQAYTVTVLQNTVTSVATGNKMLNTNNSATFNGDGKPGASISTDTATACPANGPAKRVVVQYDQTVSATATTITNYKITGCISGSSCSTGTGAPNSAGAATVTAQGGNKYAVDFTNNFATDSTLYQLTISGVQDSNGNTIAAPGNFSFQCGTDTTAPVLISATVVTATAGSTVVLLTFSEGVDNVTANVAANYKYDAAAYGTGVLSAARQSNTAQVLLTFQPALSNGGHQMRVQNVADLKTPTGNVIVDNGTTNVQPIIVNAPTGFTGGPIFVDPFGDGTTAGQIIIYDQKLYLGADTASSKIFEMNYSLTQAQTITLDGDGTFGSASDFSGLTTKYTGCNTAFSNPPIVTDICSPQTQVQSIDTIYAACVGGTSTPGMTGSACTGASGTELMFIGAAKTDVLTSAFYRSFWVTSDKSSVNTTFTFTERYSGDGGGTAAYRAANIVLFKDQLFVNFGAEQGGGGRGGRVCINPAGCTGATNSTYLSYVAFDNTQRMRRIGANSASGLRNGSYQGAGAPYGDPNVSNQAFNAINVMYEHDNDGAGGNESQLYIANGGYTNSTLGSARTGNSDGGIMRTRNAASGAEYSSKTSLPANCPSDASGCTTYWEDVTPDANTKWNSYISIPLPQNTAATGSGNCSTSWVEMDCILPYNLFVPGLKAIPYMRTAPNGDLYMLRNACSTNGFATNGGTPDFRTLRQVCPSGSEVPQLWMMPKNCGTAANCAAAGTGWRLVAEYGSTGKTNMASNTGSCGTAPNKCLANTHATLLEFVGNYLYVGWDNATYGANVWRTDMTSVATGSIPTEASFSIVNLPGIETASGGTNQKIFSHVTVNDAGKDWLIIITRDGTSAMKIYRTANDQN